MLLYPVSRHGSLDPNRAGLVLGPIWPTPGVIHASADSGYEGRGAFSVLPGIRGQSCHTDLS